jgi:DNA helicase IV
VHPEIQAEQAYIDFAYACLDHSREAATRLETMVEVGPRGGTNQARYERDVLWDTMLARLKQLHLGDASLCFGRIDLEPGPDAERFEHEVPAPDGNGEHGNGEHGNGEHGRPVPVDANTFYIGRVAVADEQQEPHVVDWRAPIAEAFYRATGRQPMGLRRRRHFATRGRQLLGIEDELFGDAAAALDGPGTDLVGRGALLSALEDARTGRLGDIVATIQAEQDEIIRSELPGVLVVQGGPGTGKTVVALHRAAYLLYTHRFPLEGQGVLVVGPNRLFLGYIEQVLPSLGEAGVELAVLADLVSPRVRVLGRDGVVASRIKGDLRMIDVIGRAVRDRERALREDLRIGYGIQTLRVTVDQSARIVAEARRRFRRHNQARRFIESELFAALARSGRDELDPAEVRERLRHELPVREALEWMWPVLAPGQLLHDLFGARSLLRSAGGHLTEAERDSLYRPRAAAVDEVIWTNDDVPLLDEARSRLGARPGRKEEDEVRTYGHIVVDEAQDLSPMQLRLITRRSLNGSMTVVGDIAQSTGAWAHADWDEVLDHLPEKKPARRAELTVGYRIPAPLLAPAAQVLTVAAPDLQPPSAVREQGTPPRWVASGSSDALCGDVVDAVRRELADVGNGNIAVICPPSLTDALGDALEVAGIAHGRAPRDGLDHQVTLIPVGYVKGLELDASIVVEPAAIVAEEAQGMRSLYVALTRATKHLTIAHARPLPEPLAGQPASGPSAELV